MTHITTPQAAVAALDALYSTAVSNLREAVARFVADGTTPTPEQRAGFRYPKITLTYAPDGPVPMSDRAFGKLNAAGVYSSTVTQPAAFAPFLIQQLEALIAHYAPTITVELSDQEIPYAYVLEGGNELGAGNVPPGDLARWFPTPLLSAVGDEIVDGKWWAYDALADRPLAHYDGLRVDYSLKRLVHYTGTDWRDFQPWILFTNYTRYVDEFVRWGIEQVRDPNQRYTKLVGSGGVVIAADDDAEDAAKRVADAPWRKYQMPAYHLVSDDGDGITLVNIGVGPSNAKNITDHLAVLRPHCWLMVGHCGGLRQSQRIGDYVLAHAYLRKDAVLDDVLPVEVPLPAIAEVQIAIQNAAATVTGERGDTLKARLRTGTVVSFADRNWELYWSRERQLLNISRAVGVDMESCMIAAQGFRHRVPYGTLLCVSDKPLHGEIKLPGAANVFYERAIGEHLKIGLETLNLLRADTGALHSRKLRSFDEPPFR
jgi:AMP nucleosidase